MGVSLGKKSYLCSVFMRSQRFIAFFLVLVTVLSMTAFNLPLVGKFYGIVGHHAVDSIDSVVLSEQDSMVR